jgi:DNA polymerase sigma
MEQRRLCNVLFGTLYSFSTVILLIRTLLEGCGPGAEEIREVAIKPYIHQSMLQDGHLSVLFGAFGEGGECR